MSGGASDGEVAQEPGQRPDEAVEGGVVPGVRRGPGPEALGGPRRVAPQHDRVAVRAGREDPDVGADERETVAAQVEVAHDRGPQPADRVGQGRHPRPGRELGRARGTAHHRAALQDDRPQAGLGQIGRRDEAVVAATDDDRVVLVRPPGERPDGHA